MIDTDTIKAAREAVARASSLITADAAQPGAGGPTAALVELTAATRALIASAAGEAVRHKRIQHAVSALDRLERNQPFAVTATRKALLSGDPEQLVAALDEWSERWVPDELLAAREIVLVTLRGLIGGAA